MRWLQRQGDPIRTRNDSMPQRGFTLLELLIALVIVSLVMTAAFGALRLGSRSWESGLERADSVEEMQAFAEFLRRQLAQTVAVAWHDEAGTRIAFAGESQKLRFVAPAPFDSGRVGLLTYALTIDREAEGSRLQLAYKPFDPGAATLGRPPDVADIITNTSFATSSLNYYGAIDSDSRASWHREWPASAELYPRLVRISFGSDADNTGWPDLLLPLRSRQAQ